MRAIVLVQLLLGAAAVHASTQGQQGLQNAQGTKATQNEQFLGLPLLMLAAGKFLTSSASPIKITAKVVPDQEAVQQGQAVLQEQPAVYQNMQMDAWSSTPGTVVNSIDSQGMQTIMMPSGYEPGTTLDGSVMVGHMTGGQEYVQSSTMPVIMTPTPVMINETPTMSGSISVGQYSSGKALPTGSLPTYVTPTPIVAGAGQQTQEQVYMSGTITTQQQQPGMVPVGGLSSPMDGSQFAGQAPVQVYPPAQGVATAPQQMATTMPAAGNNMPVWTPGMGSGGQMAQGDSWMPQKTSGFAESMPAAPVISSQSMIGMKGPTDDAAAVDGGSNDSQGSSIPIPTQPLNQGSGTGMAGAAVIPAVIEPTMFAQDDASQSGTDTPVAAPMPSQPTQPSGSMLPPQQRPPGPPRNSRRPPMMNPLQPRTGPKAPSRTVQQPANSASAGSNGPVPMPGLGPRGRPGPAAAPARPAGVKVPSAPAMSNPSRTPLSGPEEEQDPAGSADGAGVWDQGDGAGAAAADSMPPSALASSGAATAGSRPEAQASTGGADAAGDA